MKPQQQIPPTKECTGEVVVKRGKYRVELVNIGEGYCGDYDETDPEDEPLMRFDVYFDDEAMNDSSYCTQISATTDLKTKKKLAQIILDEVYGKTYVKRICEALSWIHPSWLNKEQKVKASVATMLNKERKVNNQNN